MISKFITQIGITRLLENVVGFYRYARFGEEQLSMSGFCVVNWRPCSCLPRTALNTMAAVRGNEPRDAEIETWLLVTLRFADAADAILKSYWSLAHLELFCVTTRGGRLADGHWLMLSLEGWSNVCHWKPCSERYDRRIAFTNKSPQITLL